MIPELAKDYLRGKVEDKIEDKVLGRHKRSEPPKKNQGLEHVVANHPVRLEPQQMRYAGGLVMLMLTLAGLAYGVPYIPPVY